MLSASPAIFPPSDGFFENPFSSFDCGFNSWDCHEPLFEFEPFFNPVEPQEPVISNSGSANSNPITPIASNSGSDEQTLKRKNSPSGSDDTTTTISQPNIELVSSIMDERKRRRMISNRESARRSRMRKQKHLENMRNQVTRLRLGNRELSNRLQLVQTHCQLVQNENDRLRSESVLLRQRLWEIRQVLIVRQLHQQKVSTTTSAWPCNNYTPSLNEENIIPQPLIT